MLSLNFQHKWEGVPTFPGIFTVLPELSFISMRLRYYPDKTGSGSFSSVFFGSSLLQATLLLIAVNYTF